MQGPKDVPAKALVWKQSRKPDRDGHKHYQAKTAAGCYSVAAEYQPGKGFIGYRVTQSVADKRRVIASSITVDEGKALAQRNYEHGHADARTRRPRRPMPTRVPPGGQSHPPTQREAPLPGGLFSPRSPADEARRRYAPPRAGENQRPTFFGRARGRSPFAFVRLGRAFPPALPTLARIRVPRLSPIGNRRNRRRRPKMQPTFSDRAHEGGAIG